MKVRKIISQYVLLVASILMLVSVIVPHHHHSNGMPCYEVMATEASHGDHDGEESHDCDCTGHNTAFLTSVQSHFTDGDVDLYLLPLLVLFDYINPPELSFSEQYIERDGAFFIESLHSTWITSASGLRAPPVL